MVAGWWPCCCDTSGGGTNTPDSGGCCKCFEIKIDGFTDVNCSYADYINGTYRVTQQASSYFSGECGFSFFPYPCWYETEFEVLEVEAWDRQNGIGNECEGCTDGEYFTGAYCRTGKIRLIHDAGTTSPWDYAVIMHIPFLNRDAVADPTVCDWQQVGWTLSNSSNDCSQFASWTSLTLDNGTLSNCTIDRSTDCYTDDVVVDETSATCQIRSPADCGCTNCSEVADNLEWTITFDGATNGTCSDCADLAGTFVIDQMLSNCRWVGEFPEAVTNCNGYRDVIAMVNIDASYVHINLYYGTATDDLTSQDWTTGTPTGVPTVSYSYLHTSGSACATTNQTVTPALGNFNLAGCSNTAITNSLDYEAAT